MVNGEFILNDIFEQNAKVYQTRPLRAIKYQKGMETGFVVHFTNIATENIKAYMYEAMKFFDTEAEAWDYINSNPDQHIDVDGQLVQVDVEYEAPLPILHRKVNSPDERVGYIGCHEGKYAFVSDESEQYDFYYLDSNYCDKPTWIIQDMDGNIRIWSEDLLDCCGESFFGKDDDIVYEKRVVSGKEEYIKVEVVTSQKVVYIPETLTVKELAEKLEIKPSQIVSKLFLKGEVVSMNTVLDFDMAVKIGDDFDVIFRRIEQI